MRIYYCDEIQVVAEIITDVMVINQIVVKIFQSGGPTDRQTFPSTEPRHWLRLFCLVHLIPELSAISNQLLHPCWI